MKLPIDMNLSPLWVPFMAGKGVEAVHWSTVGQAGATDSEILDFAATRGWIFFTHDLDFGTLLATLRTNKPSVIQVRSQDVLPAAIGDIVADAIRAAEAHLESGAIVTVDFLPPSYSAVADLRVKSAARFETDESALRTFDRSFPRHKPTYRY